MKKLVLFAVAIASASAVSAQTGEITSNRGENWLSQDGDWGITIDAQPFLGYVGNLFNGNMNNGGPSFSFANPDFAIQGKKLVDANTAYRGKLRIGFGSDKTTEKTPQIPQPSGNPFPSVDVEDVTKDSYSAIVLGAGLEKRVGSTRVVGVYGGEFMVGFGGSKTTNEYGNAVSLDNQVGQRTLESKNGGSFMLGLAGFVGVEWFAAPKVSLSGEYTWGLSMNSTGFNEESYEGWDPAANNGNGAVRTWSVEGTQDKTNSFSLDTGISGFSIGLNFYFQ